MPTDPRFDRMAEEFFELHPFVGRMSERGNELCVTCHWPQGHGPFHSSGVLEYAKRLAALLAQVAGEALDIVERRLSEGQGSQPWCSCEIDLAIVREERARIAAPRTPEAEGAACASRQDAIADRFCNKCGNVYRGKAEHRQFGCNYLAVTIRPASPQPEPSLASRLRDAHREDTDFDDPQPEPCTCSEFDTEMLALGAMCGRCERLAQGPQPEPPFYPPIAVDPTLPPGVIEVRGARETVRIQVQPEPPAARDGASFDLMIVDEKHPAARAAEPERSRSLNETRVVEIDPADLARTFEHGSCGNPECPACGSEVG